MAEDALPQGEVIGIVLAAVVLFSIVSIVPMVIMWSHRRKAARRTASGACNLTLPMHEPPSVERWVAEQNVTGDPGQYSQDTCPICLSSMSSSSYLANPKPAHLAGQRGPPPSRSDGSCSCGATDYRRDSGIIVLNRCHHAFHLACLTSWFEYRRYRCPICQASYSPTKAAQR